MSRATAGLQAHPGFLAGARVLGQLSGGRNLRALCGDVRQGGGKTSFVVKKNNFST